MDKKWSHNWCGWWNKKEMKWNYKKSSPILNLNFSNLFLLLINMEGKVNARLAPEITSWPLLPLTFLVAIFFKSFLYQSICYRISKAIKLRKGRSYQLEGSYRALRVSSNPLALWRRHLAEREEIKLNIASFRAFFVSSFINFHKLFLFITLTNILA